MKNYEVYKKTSDDWYPNYPENLVSVRYCSFLDQEHYRWENKFLVCVWGRDDCGMERWYFGDHGNLAWNTFIDLIAANDVTKKLCKEKGMESA